MFSKLALLSDVIAIIAMKNVHAQTVNISIVVVFINLIHLMLKSLNYFSYFYYFYGKNF